MNKNQCRTLLISILLFTFSLNVMAYSQKTLNETDFSEVNILKTKIKKAMPTRITRSPDMVNRLRLIFTSKKKTLIN